MLDRIMSGPTAHPRRILLYGVAGVGKSTWAASAPNPIFVQTEEGLDDIGAPRFPMASSFEEVMQYLAALYQEDHPYRTVVIDSLDWLERLIHAVVCEKRGVGNIEEIGFAKGYTFALAHWKDVLDGLDALRSQRGMTAIVIAHAKVERFENPETDAYDRYVPRLHKAANALVTEWADEALFANYKVHTRTSDEGFNRKRAQGLGTGERILRTSERPSHLAKNRLGLPDEMPLAWDAYAEFLPA